jgi:hypothetical protein
MNIHHLLSDIRIPTLIPFKIQNVCVSAEQPKHCMRIDLPSAKISHYSKISETLLVSPEDLFHVTKAISMTTLIFILFISSQAFHQSSGFSYPLRLVNQTKGRVDSCRQNT